MAQSSISSFHDYARGLRSEIDAALDKWSRLDDNCPARLREAIRHSLLAPGKRLRPILVLMAAEACGSDRTTAMPAACAVEMVHTYSLIHDDLPAMDNDDLRRGRPTCHAKYGEATAILAGDALLAAAFEQIASGIVAPDIAARCCCELAAAAGPCALVGGQMDDLTASDLTASDLTASDLTASDLTASDLVADVERLERIHHRKTGAMFRVSLRLGGLIARAPDEQMRVLDTYGKNIGLAFQIADDLLDVHGSSSSLGKRTGKDAAAGKVTFPLLLGAAASAARAEDLIERACTAAAQLGTAGTYLEDLARFVLERDR